MSDKDEQDDDSRPLTPQERLFVEAFASPESVTYSKGTRSAEAAHYEQPHNSQWKLRKRPAVIAAIEEFHKIAAAGLGKVMSDLEHTRLLALEKGDLAVAARCSELQGKRLGAFSDVLIIPPIQVQQYDERVALEAQRLARLLLPGCSSIPMLTVEPQPTVIETQPKGKSA